MKNKSHWEHIYETKDVTNVSWFQPHAVLSVRLIRATGLDTTARIIDVGGGASTLVDDLLSNGYEEVTVLDISGAALQRSKDRLGQRAESVTWVEADITQANLPEDYYDLWHDRAVFHFLTDESDRAAYVEPCNEVLRPAATSLLRHSGWVGRKSAVVLTLCATALRACTTSSGMISNWLIRQPKPTTRRSAPTRSLFIAIATRPDGRSSQGSQGIR